jgi:hypothetical protein
VRPALAVDGDDVVADIGHEAGDALLATSALGGMFATIVNEVKRRGAASYEHTQDHG